MLYYMTMIDKKSKKTLDQINFVVLSKLTTKQELDVSALTKLAFVDVDEAEATADFYHPMSAQVLAYSDEKLVGWAGVHETEQDHLEKTIKLGGYGICTHPDWQRRGIASKVAEKAMEFLKESGCEVGFLSVNPGDKGSVRLHGQFGFVMLPQQFSWTNSSGEVKKDIGGMIAPIESKQLFEYILSSDELFYVGHGYW